MTTDLARSSVSTVPAAPADYETLREERDALYAYGEETTLELKDAYDMLAAAQRQAAARGQENAALRAKVAMLIHDLEATQVALAEAVAAENEATTQAVALHRAVFVHGACSCVALGEFATEGTVRVCDECGVTWEAIDLQFTDVAIDEDGQLTGGEATTMWRLAVTG